MLRATHEAKILSDSGALSWIANLGNGFKGLKVAHSLQTLRTRSTKFVKRQSVFLKGTVRNAVSIAAIIWIASFCGVAHAETVSPDDKADAYVCRDAADPFTAEAANSKTAATELKMTDYVEIGGKFLDRGRAATIGHVDDLKNAATKALEAYGDALDDAAYQMRKCAKAAQ